MALIVTGSQVLAADSSGSTETKIFSIYAATFVAFFFESIAKPAFDSNQ